MGAENITFAQGWRELRLDPRERGIWDTSCADDMKGARDGAGVGIPWFEVTKNVGQPTFVPTARVAIAGPPTSLLSLYLSDWQLLSPGNALTPPAFFFSIAQGADNAWTNIPGANGIYTPADPKQNTGLLIQVSGVWGTSWRIDAGIANPQSPDGKVKIRAIITRSTSASGWTVFKNPLLFV